MPRIDCTTASPSSAHASARSLTLSQIVRRLNAHHAKTLAGFYGDERLPGRWFRARVVKRVTLEVFDWCNWVTVPDGTAFRDHNGRPVLTVRYPASDVFER